MPGAGQTVGNEVAFGPAHSRTPRAPRDPREGGQISDVCCLVAQAGIAGFVGGWVIIAVVAAAIVGIGMAALVASRVTIPPWWVRSTGSFCGIVVAVVAIKFLVLTL